MKDTDYFLLRKFFFWFFCAIFFISTPLVLFYSLGYKFDPTTKRFLKTGAIFIKTTPENAQIILNGKELKRTTPCILKELIPSVYEVTLLKNGFHPYCIKVKVKSSSVSKLNITLVPKINKIEQLPLSLNVYKFFVLKTLFSKKFLIFADKGVFLFDENFKIVKKINLHLPKSIVKTIKEVKRNKETIVFWNKNKLWIVDISNEDKNISQRVYRTKEPIRNVFFGLKGKYLIVLEGVKIIALDIKNPQIQFPILKLRDSNSEIFYDSSIDTLYLKDKIPDSEQYCLFKIKFIPSIYERKNH